MIWSLHIHSMQITAVIIEILSFGHTCYTWSFEKKILDIQGFWFRLYQFQYDLLILHIHNMQIKMQIKAANIWNLTL